MNKELVLMQFHSKDLILFILLVLFAQYCNAQFHQNLDSLDITIDSTLSTNYTPKSGVHHSNYKNDSNVFHSGEHYLSSVDATRIMQTKTPGLLVNANAFTPGASSSTILRGYRSIIGENEPLIIFDGMPIDNSNWGSEVGGVDQSNRLIDINPNDIESIELIKSAAGRAKYGIAGGNGVIIITSKKGGQNSPKISVRSSLTIDQLSSMPALQNIYAQGRQFDGERIYRGPETNEGFSWGPKISDLEYDGSDYDFDKNGRLVPIGSGNGNAANTYDHLDFFQDGISNNINANIKGGSDVLQYFVSAGYNNQQGVIPKNKYTRYNAFSNIAYRPNNKLEIQGSVSLTSSQANRSQRGSNVKGIMLGLLRSSPSFDNSNNNSDPVNDITTYELANGNQRSYRSGIYDNPYWTINKNAYNDNVRRNIINLNTNYSIFQNLELRLSLGSDQYIDERNGGIDINPGRDVGSAFENKITHATQNVDASLHHKKEINGLELNTSLGINYNGIKRSFDLQRVTTLLSSNNLSITNGLDLTSSFTEIDRKRLGGYIFVDASYNNLLNVNASLRQDDSNHFGANTNGFSSYGLGVGLELNRIFSNQRYTPKHQLLLHGSVGRFGNDIAEGFNNTLFTTTSNIGGDGLIDNVIISGPEISIDGINNKLTAETNTTVDIGIDFKSENEKYQIGILFYKEVSSGVLLETETASSSGVSSLIENIGSIENYGLEVSIGVNLLDSKTYNWNASIAFSKNTNKVTALNNTENTIRLAGFTSTNTAAIVDQEYGVIFGSRFLLNDNDQLVIDDDGFPLAELDRVVGNPNPDWTMYINNTVTINDKINITADIDIKSGGDVWCGTCGILNYFGTSEVAASEVGTTQLFQGVTTSGQPNTVEAQLAPSEGDSNNFYRVRYAFGGLSEMSTFDASWIRLRTISIDYNISDLLKVNAISDFSIGLFARNLFVITDYPSIDPETSLVGNNTARGLEYFNNPGSRQIGAVINLTF